MKIIQFMMTAALTVGVIATTGAAYAKEMKASVDLPPKNDTVVHGWVPFVERVEKETDGAVKIKLFVAGSLLGAKAVSTGIRDGVVDLGYVIVGYTPAQFPHVSFIGDMAGIGSDPVVVTAATTEMILTACDACMAEFKLQGNVYTGTYGVPPMVIMSREMLDTPAAIKGKQVRSSGGVWDRFLQSVGAVPINLTSPEQYEALSRGLIDAAFHVSSSLQTFDLWDLVKDVVLVDIGAYRAINTFAFNPDSWAGLTSEQRKIILEAASDANFDIAHAYTVTGNKALEQSKEKGIRVRDLPSEWQKAVSDFTVSEKQELVSIGQEKRGVADAEIYVQKMTELVDKWTAIYAELGGDVEAMKIRFKDEIISKIDPNKYGL